MGVSTSKPLLEWSVGDVSESLESLGSNYVNYKPRIVENGIDGDFLISLLGNDDAALLEETLDDLDITNRLHRRVILNKLLPTKQNSTREKRKAQVMEEETRRNKRKRRDDKEATLAWSEPLELEGLPTDIMTHICEFLDLPTKWRLSQCSKTLERVVTKECKSLWRRIHFVQDGVAENVCHNVLTDDMVEFLFVQVNARDVTESISFESCLNISGLCLRQVRHSRVLRTVHFARTWGKVDDEAIIEENLRTCLPYNLVNVKLPFPPPVTGEISRVKRMCKMPVRWIFLRDLQPKMNSEQQAHHPPTCRICNGHRPDAAATERHNHNSIVESTSDVCEDCWSGNVSPTRVLYMETQPELNGRMRAILVDWMSELCAVGFLASETLFLAVNLVDRYLERKTISRQKFQLLGASSIRIACRVIEKYQYPPEADVMANYCDGAYSAEEVIEMEEDIPRTLGNQIVTPTAYDFLASIQGTDIRIFQLSSYLLEGTLLSYDLNRYLPSQLAAAAILIAERSLDRKSHNSAVFQCTNYSEADIAPVARAVLSAKESIPTNLNGLDTKYSASKHGSVTTLVSILISRRA